MKRIFLSALLAALSIVSATEAHAYVTTFDRTFEATNSFNPLSPETSMKDSFAVAEAQALRKALDYLATTPGTRTEFYGGEITFGLIDEGGANLYDSSGVIATVTLRLVQDHGQDTIADQEDFARDPVALPALGGWDTAEQRAFRAGVEATFKKSVSDEAYWSFMITNSAEEARKLVESGDTLALDKALR